MRVLTLVPLWLHVVGIVVWLGGVVYQAHVLRPAARGGDAATFAEAARRLVAVAAQRDFTHLVRLHLSLATATDPTPALASIARLDRFTILLGVVIIYLGLAISRS